MEYLHSNTHSNTKVSQLLIQTTSTTTHTTPSAAAQTPHPYTVTHPPTRLNFITNTQHYRHPYHLHKTIIGNNNNK
jgi:hypothetical protein